MQQLEALIQSYRDFVKEREWDQFHSPKNLVMALTSEVGELSDHLRWMTEEESLSVSKDSKKYEQVKEELADIFLYLLRIADVMKIDLLDASQLKMQQNAEKYPVELAKGNCKKYTELTQ